MVRGRHRNDIRVVIASRVLCLARRAVTCRRNEQRTGITYRGLHCRRPLASAPAIVRNAHNVVSPGLETCRVKYRSRRIRDVAGSVRPEEFEGHHLDVPVHADDSNPVIPDRSDRPGYVRTVSVVVDRIIVVVGEIPAAGVVDISVTVVVEPVDRLVRIDPNIRRKVGMVVIDPGVNYPDHNVR